MSPKSVHAHLQAAQDAVRAGKNAAAEKAFRKAIALAPGDPNLWGQLSDVLERLGRVHEAADAVAKAHELDPSNLIAPLRRAPLELRAGLLKRGWATYELTQHAFFKGDRPLPQPRWQGEPLAGKSILLTSDQGVGEQIMFASMLPDLIAAGATITLECEARLIPILARSFPGVRLVPWQTPQHPAVTDAAIDYRCIFGAAGRWLRPSFESFPRNSGYLKADAAKTAMLRARYTEAARGRPVIALCWHSAAVTYGNEKSIGVATLAPLLARDDVLWVNAQYGDARRQIDTARILTDEDVDPTGDLDAAAAQIAACDRVITVSSATAHLGGALGRPTWVMLSKQTGRHWYWYPERGANPWYPSAACFVQKTQDQWPDVIATVDRALTKSLRQAT
ncbi:MAG: tetratricopeptide repeat protein [Rhodobacteraceae bacterium]|nr:tetratricopeptide repeat protein [Paracoccaceae bacterium]